jgi:transposase-like protein
MPRILKRAQFDDAVKLYLAGKNASEVAREIGVKNSTVGKWIRIAGIKSRGKRIVISRLDEIVLAYRSGESLKSISDRTGLNRPLLMRRRASRQRLVKKQGSRYGGKERLRGLVHSYIASNFIFGEEVGWITHDKLKPLCAHWLQDLSWGRHRDEFKAFGPVGAQ